MILGPDDPRAITGTELEEARRNTELWNCLLGIAPPTEAEKVQYGRDIQDILDMIGWEQP